MVSLEDIDRNSAAEDFLHKNCRDCEILKLKGDASFRSYSRLIGDNKSFIFMDCPPERESIEPYLRIAEILKDLELSAPEIIAFDSRHGFIIMEDLGDDLFTRVLIKSPEIEFELYKKAIDVLLAINQYKPPADVKLYDLDKYIEEATLFIDWYLPTQGYEITQDVRQPFQEAIREIFHGVNLRQNILVMRDYHADNLLWLPERNGLRSVGLLDFQDALIGDPAYDLVSLLEDARRDVDPDTVQNCIDYYLNKSPHEDRDNFLKRYAFLGAQRNLKIIGIFHRLNKRDNKPGYLDLLPRVRNHLNKNLRHPSLTRLREVISAF